MDSRITTSWWFIIVLFMVGLVFGGYSVYIGRGIQLQYDEIDTLSAKTSVSQLQTLNLGDSPPLYLVDPVQLTANNAWMYVSKTAPLDASYQPKDLVDITVATGQHTKPMQLRREVNSALARLFASAERDGYILMVSSAYRSIDEQRSLYDEFVAKRGEAQAKQFVLSPGASEHHTGFAVDITDSSPGCKLDTDKCLISPDTSAWVAEHAATAGFIVRYPSGKEPITGITHEPWHLRYVGIALATRLTDNDLTLDEFIEQVAPGRIR